jgi:MFS family permease
MLDKLKQGLTRNVVFLGVVSGLTDISSEMLYPLMPLFITSVLGAPMSALGFIEGSAEATASLLKAAGGALSDKSGKRKPFVVAGYGLSSLSKPLMAAAFSWPMVLCARIIDRIGKGIRTSARDALVASSTEKPYWGKAFGFHRAMDTTGAAIGPFAALLLLNLGIGYRPIFLMAFFPALLGVLILMWLVKEKAPPQPSAAASAGKKPGFFESLRAMPPQYKRFLLFYGIFAIGNSSDAFLLLRAKNLGFGASRVILAYIAYNVVYALCAGPAGWLSDRIGRRKTMAFGFCVFAAVYAGFAFAGHAWLVWPLFAAYGFYGAFNEGVASATVADFSGEANRATAMGIFQATTGLLAFCASLAAGFLWDAISPSAPFIVGSTCAALAAVLMIFTREPAKAQTAIKI